MTPADLREALAEDYGLKAPSRFVVSRRARSFTYSDGAAYEAYVADVIANATDLRVGSPELARAIRDWPSQYHLSPARANLFRPLAERLTGSILEIGAGNGAITRFLGEAGATVLALEGSLTRARIVASRCRDLENVTIACDAVDGLPVSSRFDVVTLVGVLEYSRMYMRGDDAVHEMLAAARRLLAPGGILVIAIENQLGVKYLAGAPEDHLGVPWSGVTDAYGAKSPVTFGRRELERRVRAAGFAEVEFAYPFPDYKLPGAIVTEAGFAHPSFNVADLIATAHAQRFDETAERAFSEALSRDVLVRNGLGPDTANSFLCVARTAIHAKAGIEPGTVLAYGYTVARDRPYAGETRFVAKDGAISVERRALYSGQARPDSAVAQARAQVEPYFEGEVLYRGLQRLVARRGWTVAQVAEWAAPWVELLRGRAKAAALPAELFDCTPFNVVRDRNGGLHTFDLEWRVAGEAPSLEQVVFRGLYNGLLRLDFAGPPAPGVPLAVHAVASQVMGHLGLSVDEAKIAAWIAQDYAVTGVISGTPRATAMPDLPSLRVPRETAPTAAELEALRAMLQSSESDRAGTAARAARLAARQRELDSILARPHHRLASWIGGLVEPFPKLRALARAPFDALAGHGRPRVGAIVHHYYDDLWPELRERLARIPFLERAYVSIPEDARAETEAEIARDFPGARVRRFPNRGRDVLPFLEFLAEAQRDGLEVIVKVHGKRSPHVASGAAWRRDMLDKLLGSEAEVRAIVERFRVDPGLGIVGPGGHVVPGSYYWERNAARVTELAERIGAPLTGPDFHYVAGSMFWARVAALAPLLRLRLTPADFEPEPAPVDGTAAHALERCFPIAARVAGLRIEETANPAGTTVRDFAP